jgi:riboflavin biosynthesis pyrimidine reductase
MQGKTMANPDSHVTIHMAASLDGFIARKDGSVDWLETSRDTLVSLPTKIFEIKI